MLSVCDSQASIKEECVASKDSGKVKRGHNKAMRELRGLSRL